MIHKWLFRLCRNCNRLATESATNIWLVDHFACRCIYLPFVKDIHHDQR